MKLLSAPYIMTCDESFRILEKSAVVFDESILDIGPIEEMQERYPQATVIDLPDSVILPGLINAHVHLEFSANVATLQYGSFMGWLESVIANRESLQNRCDDFCIQQAIDKMLSSGTTTIGAVSSFGHDLKPLAHSPLNTIYFIEAIGSNPDMKEALLELFQNRLEEAKQYQSQHFIPAASIHSPYSIHPDLAHAVLDIAREENLLISTHFMESQDERKWLSEGEGGFLEFFEKLLGIKSQPHFTPESFLESFSGLPTLYAHALFANENELDQITKQSAGIIHCPISNRLLSGSKLDIQKIIDHHIPLLVATDGLSSNLSLSLWDEMRTALMMQTDSSLHDLACLLLQGTTRIAAQALQLNKGSVESQKDADLIVMPIPGGLQNPSDLPLQLLLHAQQAEKVFISGKEILTAKESQT